MKIVDRYIARAVISACLTVLLVLLAIFAFFAFIEELEDIGRGTYSVLTAAAVVGLKLPRLAYDLFPIAALIGCLLGLGALEERNEIAVVRIAGVSKLRVIFSVMKAGFILVVIAVLIGEVVFPPAEQLAREMRGLALDNRQASRSDFGYWARDGQSFIHIREVLPEAGFNDISIYEFDQQKRLLAATRAASAEFSNNTWALSDIKQTRFEDSLPLAMHVEQAAWDSILDPDLIGMVSVRPENLSLFALIRYVDFAQKNGQSPQRFEHAMWVKLGYPLATGVMVLLAIPLVMRSSRNVTMGRRILVGALIGLGFHVLNQASGHLGVVFGMAPFVSALGPTLVLLVLSLALNSKTT